MFRAPRDVRVNDAPFGQTIDALTNVSSLVIDSEDHQNVKLVVQMVTGVALVTMGGILLHKCYSSYRDRQDDMITKRFLIPSSTTAAAIDASNDVNLNETTKIMDKKKE